jgi:hypothetical protein
MEVIECRYMAVEATVAKELIALSEGRQRVMVLPQKHVIFHEYLYFMHLYYSAIHHLGYRSQAPPSMFSASCVLRPSSLRPGHINYKMARPLYRFIISETIQAREAEGLADFVEVTCSPGCCAAIDSLQMKGHLAVSWIQFQELSGPTNYTTSFILWEPQTMPVLAERFKRCGVTGQRVPIVHSRFAHELLGMDPLPESGFRDIIDGITMKLLFVRNSRESKWEFWIDGDLSNECQSSLIDDISVSGRLYVGLCWYFAQLSAVL